LANITLRTALADWLIICLALLTVSIVVSVMNWHRIYIVKELMYNGWLKFILQYILLFGGNRAFCVNHCFRAKGWRVVV